VHLSKHLKTHSGYIVKLYTSAANGRFTPMMQLSLIGVIGVNWP